MNITLQPKGRIKGKITVPGDKSISHRAVMLGSLASGVTRVSNFLMSEDCLSTLKCFTAMGVKSNWEEDGTLVITGSGAASVSSDGLREPKTVLDAGNSGSTVRMMTGILAGQSFRSFFTGDNSLSVRPMQRIIQPLTKMGANIWAREDNYLPMAINGSPLKGIRYTMPVASAQVKSALIFAGLFAKGVTIIKEPRVSRDHTERMLNYFGHPLEIQGDITKGNIIKVSPLGPRGLKGKNVDIPGDISSAAFFLALAAIVPGSEITVKNVGINPGRAGFLSVLKKMKAEIKIENKRRVGGEPVADITVKYGLLKSIKIGADKVPGLIDELPLIAMLASQAEGTTEISGAGELRIKESDRISSTVAGLRAMGADVKETPDGMLISGPVKLKGATIESCHDHRIAMTFAIASQVAKGETQIIKADCVAISFPGFFELLATLGSLNKAMKLKKKQVKKPASSKPKKLAK